MLNEEWKKLGVNGFLNGLHHGGGDKNIPFQWENIANKFIFLKEKKKKVLRE